MAVQKPKQDIETRKSNLIKTTTDDPSAYLALLGLNQILFKVKQDAFAAVKRKATL